MIIIINSYKSRIIPIPYISERIYRFFMRLILNNTSCITCESTYFQHSSISEKNQLVWHLWLECNLFSTNCINRVSYKLITRARSQLSQMTVDTRLSIA